MTTEIKRHGSVWQWRIRHNGKLYGGLGRTKADAENDCAIVKADMERDMQARLAKPNTCRFMAN